jgi:hypothetical protein
MPFGPFTSILCAENVRHQRTTVANSDYFGYSLNAWAKGSIRQKRGVKALVAVARLLMFSAGMRSSPVSDRRGRSEAGPGRDPGPVEGPRVKLPALSRSSL